jgi:hypothetical protein
MTGEPLEVRGAVYGPDGEPVPVMVEVPDGPLADAITESALTGVSLPEEVLDGVVLRPEEP